jgi:hypothetical protein
LTAPDVDRDDLAGSMAAAELALRREDRERTGLVNLGPGALAFAEAMDAAGARALELVRADAAEESGSLQGLVAAVGGPWAAPEPGFNSFFVWAMLISSLHEFAEGQAENGTVEGRPETVEIAGNSGTITSTTTVNAVTNGSQLSVDLTLKVKGQVVDRATGAILYGIDSIASGHIDVDFCPDASGKALANVKLTSSEIYTTAGGATRGVSKEFSGAVVITVGEDANIVAVEGTAQGSEESRGGVASPGGGESTLTESTRTAGGDIANDGEGNRLAGSDRAPGITFGGEGSTLEDQGKLWGGMTLFVETMVTAAATEAEKRWQGGKCVELIVDPEGGEIGADETESVTATLKHKIEGNELDKPVVASLSGVQSVDPAGVKQPAPATVTYTAGPKDGDIGRITFKSVSNRGIAEKTVTFTVGGQRLEVGLAGIMTTSMMGISYTTEISAPKVILTRQTDGTYFGSGAVKTVVDLHNSLCPEPFIGTGTLRLRATREEVADPSLSRDWTIVHDSDATAAGQKAWCQDTHGTRIDISSFTGNDGPTGGFMFVLGDVVFPATGGTKEIKHAKSVGPARNTIVATMKVKVVKDQGGYRPRSAQRSGVSPKQALPSFARSPAAAPAGRRIVPVM